MQRIGGSERLNVAESAVNLGAEPELLPRLQTPYLAFSPLYPFPIQTLTECHWGITQNVPKAIYPISQT